MEMSRRLQARDFKDTDQSSPHILHFLLQMMIRCRCGRSLYDTLALKKQVSCFVLTVASRQHPFFPSIALKE